MSLSWSSAWTLEGRYKKIVQDSLGSGDGEQQFPPESLRRGRKVSPEEVAASRALLAEQLGLTPEQLEACPLGMGM